MWQYRPTRSGLAEQTSSSTIQAGPCTVWDVIILKPAFLGLFSINFINNICFGGVWTCFLGVWTYILCFGLVFYVSGLIFWVFGVIFCVLKLYFGFWTCILVSGLVFGVSRFVFWLYGLFCLVFELILWVSGRADRRADGRTRSPAGEHVGGRADGRADGRKRGQPQQPKRAFVMCCINRGLHWVISRT